MKRKLLYVFLLSFIFIKGYPQSFISKVIRGEKGISKDYIEVDRQPIPFNGAQVKSLLGLDRNSELSLQRTEQDKLGFIHYRYYQTYKGIPVENTMYIIHTKNGLLKSLGGAIVTDFDARMGERSVQKISGAQAANIAVNYVGAKVYAWQDAGMEQRIKEQTQKPNATYLPKASLVWYSATDDVSPNDLRLCYKVDVYAIQPLSRAYYFVDAITGNVLGKKDEIFYADATGTANTGYSGSRTIHSNRKNGKYYLRDYTKGDGIITLHGESNKYGHDYTSTNVDWILPGKNVAALDAHYGVSQTYAFYMANFGRNSYDDLGTALYSYVNEPTYTDNAFWDGSAMNFCERANADPGGVTGIDVTGHELTHGVTQESSSLNYSKEPGAINESMSDIMGKSVQFWSKPADKNWVLSNDMNWGIRSLSNPGAYGQPDTYKGVHWATGSADSYGVHTNSGVGNFMFYLLVDGGSGANDNGDAFSVTGIGLSKAYQIIYRTNTVYLTSTSNYKAWRTACINAAKDLYGSNEVTQVKNAWDAVGVGNASSTSIYCVTGGITTYEYIKKVAIGTISNTTGDDGGYGNYTSLSTNRAAGTTATIKLTPGFNDGGPYTEYWTVFIDYNQDGDFSDADERVTNGSKSTTVTRTFTVPSTAKSGATRMRVIMEYDSTRANPCKLFDYGEAEDYTVNITGGTFTGIASANSITSNSLLNSLVVSPNPIKTSSANLILQMSKAAPVNIRITDLSGRILRTETINSIIAGKNNYSLNNLNLMPGTYMIIAQQGSSIIARGQFIVEK